MNGAGLPGYLANRGLFDDTYLRDQVAPALPGTPGAPAAPYLVRQAGQALDEIGGLWWRRHGNLSQDAEGVRTFVQDVYRRLGPGAWGQHPRRAGDPAGQPDLALFPDSAAATRGAAAPRDDPGARHREALMVIQVERLGAALDAAGRGAALQAHLGRCGLPWGVLTDGAHWRLYHHGPPAPPDAFFAVDLEAILLLPAGPARLAAFSWFYAFFRPEAFGRTGGPAFLDSVLAAGAPPGPLSFAAAAEQVLVRAGDGQPMHYRTIADRALALGLLATHSRNPAATMYAQILREIGHGGAGKAPSRFVKRGPGLVGLARWEK